MKSRNLQILLMLSVWLGGLLSLHAGVSTAVSNTFALCTQDQPPLTSHIYYLHGDFWLSPVAETEAPAPKLTIDGEAASGWSKANPWWDSTQVADGWHTFVLTERNKTFEVTLLVLNQPAIHAGILEADETWTADQVHLVEFPVTVPAGVTLTIADNAVVKFFDDASLTVDEGGMLVLGKCVFTHLADDTAGGDTNWDGEVTAPVAAKYELVLKGEVTTVGIQPDIRYAKSNQWVFLITAVNCDAGTQYAIAGQPVTVTADYTDTLNGYRLDWRSTPTGVRFSEVEDSPYSYSACFTMPNSAAMVRYVVQKIVSTSAWSAWGTVDTRSTFGGQLLDRVRRVSRKAQTQDDNAYVELTDSKGEFVGEIDALNWDSSAVADGWYTATIYEGDQTYSAEVAVINSPDVAVHGGMLNSSETWSADTVHIVQYITRVSNGRTLMIAPNAIVKVCPGAGFQVDEGGKLVLGDGCVITDIADDSVGGDTNMDAAATSSPDDDDGTVFNLASENVLESEGTPEIKVKAPVERTITLLPGWNAMVFDFALDTDSTRALKQLNAMELDLEHQTYIQPDEFVPNTLYWFFATRLATLKVKGRTEVEDLPETALSQFTPYGNAYGIVPEGCEIYEWKDGLFQRFTGTHFLPGHGYFIRKVE